MALVVPGVAVGIQIPLCLRWSKVFAFTGLAAGLAVRALETVGNGLLLKQGQRRRDVVNENFF